MKRVLLGLSVLVLLFSSRSSPAFDIEPLGFTALDNGDVNGDWERDVSDAVYILDYLFLGGPAPAPILKALCSPDLPSMQNGDANGDRTLDLSDAIRLLSWLFGGGSEPTPVSCGEQLLPADGSGAAAGGTDRPIAWRAAGPVAVNILPTGMIIFSGVAPGLRVPHLGLSSIEYQVQALLTGPTSVVITGGTYTFTAADGDLLTGRFTNGALDLTTGVYFLEFEFAGGTGRFASATGQGRTDGVVDLVNGTFSAKNFARISY